jgi:hypothetical protein
VPDLPASRRCRSLHCRTPKRCSLAPLGASYLCHANAAPLSTVVGRGAAMAPILPQNRTCRASNSAQHICVTGGAVAKRRFEHQEPMSCYIATWALLRAHRRSSPCIELGQNTRPRVPRPCVGSRDPHYFNTFEQAKFRHVCQILYACQAGRAQSSVGVFTQQPSMIPVPVPW